jgi:hypothetical protein
MRQHWEACRCRYDCGGRSKKRTEQQAQITVEARVAHVKWTLKKQVGREFGWIANKAAASPKAQHATQEDS